MVGPVHPRGFLSLERKGIEISGFSSLPDLGILRGTHGSRTGASLGPLPCACFLVTCPGFCAVTIAEMRSWAHSWPLEAFPWRFM